MSAVSSVSVTGGGFVFRCDPPQPLSIATGPRLALLSDGRIACSFMRQTALGTNDFEPWIAFSSDSGASWNEPRPLFPEQRGRFAIFGSISSGGNGELIFFGQRTVIDSPGESFWSDEMQGLKANELFWTRSANDGVTWGPVQRIAMPIPGAAEAPGAMCRCRGGRLVCCYSPYNTFDPGEKVVRNQVVCLSSADDGGTWDHSRMLALDPPESGAAEAWVIELSDGCLVGAGWHLLDGADPENKFAISRDGGQSFGPTRSTGIRGQSVGLAPLPGGRLAMVYNQRKFGTTGVWLALARPGETDFGLQANSCVWEPQAPSGSVEHKDWTHFGFGEPCPLLLPGGGLLVVLWVADEWGHGIRWVRVDAS
jgi:hypothetical protein